jgi:hypothetical protein
MADRRDDDMIELEDDLVAATSDRPLPMVADRGSARDERR